MTSLRSTRRARWFAVALVALAAACSAQNVAVQGSPDAEATGAEPDAAADEATGDAGRKDARAADKPDAKKPSKESGPGQPAVCEQGASCAEGDQCKENDGNTYRFCNCSAGKLACIVRTPAAPSACASGATCTAASECATDDGTTATYCFCDAGKLKCGTLTAPDPACAVDALKCAATAPAGATQWMMCFKREFGSAFGATCKTQDFGMGSSGVAMLETCPVTPPTTGATCGIGGSLACGCETGGDPCVCSCMFGNWRCL